MNPSYIFNFAKKSVCPISLAAALTSLTALAAALIVAAYFLVSISFQGLRERVSRYERPPTGYQPGARNPQASLTPASKQRPHTWLGGESARWASTPPNRHSHLTLVQPARDLARGMNPGFQTPPGGGHHIIAPANPQTSSRSIGTTYQGTPRPPPQKEPSEAPPSRATQSDQGAPAHSRTSPRPPCSPAP